MKIDDFSNEGKAEPRSGSLGGMEKKEGAFLLGTGHSRSIVLHRYSGTGPDAGDPDPDEPVSLRRLRGIEENIFQHFPEEVGIGVHLRGPNDGLHVKEGKPFLHSPNDPDDRIPGGKRFRAERERTGEVPDLAEEPVDTMNLFDEQAHPPVQPGIEGGVLLEKVEADPKGGERGADFVDHDGRKFSEGAEVLEASKLFQPLVDEGVQTRIFRASPPDEVKESDPPAGAWHGKNPGPALDASPVDTSEGGAGNPSILEAGPSPENGRKGSGSSAPGAGGEGLGPVFHPGDAEETAKGVVGVEDKAARHGEDCDGLGGFMAELRRTDMGRSPNFRGSVHTLLRNISSVPDQGA